MPARFADGAKSLVPPRVIPVGEEYGGIRKQCERRPRRTMWPDLAARGHARAVSTQGGTPPPSHRRP